MSRRTGLIVCPAHHEGGSTLVTRGACARAPADASRSRRLAAKAFGSKFGARSFIRVGGLLTFERPHVGDRGGDVLARELALEGGHLAAPVRDRGDHARGVS